MRTTGLALAAIGFLFGVIVTLQIIGNRDLAIPGRLLLPDAASGDFRLLAGPCAWVSGMAFGAAVLTFRGVRPLAWLALLILVLLFLPVSLSGTFVPSATLLITVSLADVVVLAVLVAVVGGAISRARDRAIARTAPSAAVVYRAGASMSLRIRGIRGRS